MHRTLMIGAGAIFFAVAGAGAQQSTPEARQTSGPSLNETIQFIDEVYQQQPPLVSHLNDTYSTSEVRAEADNPCGMALTSRNENGRNRYRIALDRADALSVTTAPTGDGFTGFQVTFNGAGTEQPLPTQETPTPLLPESFVGDNSLSGVLLSVKPDEMVFVTGEGKPFLVRLSDVRKIEIYHDENHKQDWYAGDDHNFSHFSPSEGFLLFKRAEIIGKGKKAKETPYFEVTAFPLSSGARKMGIPPVANEDTANHLAKALIHAIVLCHADAKQPLF